VARAKVATRDARWFAAPKSEAHESVFDVIRSIHDRTRWIWAKDKYHAELYEGEGALRESTKSATWEGTTLPYNVVRSAIDTVCAKVAKERPLPQVFTNRGDWGLQKRARRASEAIEGEFHRLKFFEDLTEEFVTDALDSRAAVAKVCREDDKVTIQRMLPWEIYVDPTDAKYGAPRNMHHVSTLDMGVLIAMFADSPPKRRAIIKAANSRTHDFAWEKDRYHEESTVDRVQFVESWHLPSSPKAKDGRHTLVIEGCTLLDEVWEKQHFPFVVMRFKKRRIGFWGCPLAEIIEGFQFDAHVLAERVQDAIHQTPAGIIFEPRGANIVESHMTNANVLRIQHAAGFEPKWFAPQPFNPALNTQRREVCEDALNFAGVSTMSAHSQRPTGITAAKGLQVLDDVETERFAMFVRAYQAFCKEIGERILDVIRDIAEDQGDYDVVYSGKRGNKDLKWARDFSLDEQSYNVKVFTTSVLSKRPEARYQQLQEGFNSGLYTREQFFRLNEMPDLEAENDLETATKLLADDQIQTMLDAEPADIESRAAYQQPEAFQDLEYALKRAQISYCLARMNKCPEANLELLRDYMADCQGEIDKLKAPPPQPLAPAGAPTDMPPPAGALPPDGGFPPPGDPGMAPPMPMQPGPPPPVM
jgi:hypothetical protein